MGWVEVALQSTHSRCNIDAMIARPARMAFCSIGFCWLLATPGFGQQPPTLLSAREVLGDLAKQSNMPSCEDAGQLMASKNEDTRFLLQRLNQAGWKNVDPDYAASLDILDKTLM